MRLGRTLAPLVAALQGVVAQITTLDLVDTAILPVVEVSLALPSISKFVSNATTAPAASAVLAAIGLDALSLYELRASIAVKTAIAVARSAILEVIDESGNGIFSVTVQCGPSAGQIPFNFPPLRFWSRGGWFWRWRAGEAFAVGETVVADVQAIKLLQN